MLPSNRASLPIILTTLVAAGAAAFGQAPNAQTKSDPIDTGTSGGYRVSETARPVAPQKSPEKSKKISEEMTEPAPAPSVKKPSGERYARFEYVSGNVTWRPDENTTWKRANLFEGLRQNAQVWVNAGGRAELRFEDGSILRLGNDAVVILTTVYRDEQGPFTQIKMTSGLATLIVRRENSVYEVDTPILKVKTNGDSLVRIGAGEKIEVGVRRGHANVESTQAKETLYSGDFVALKDGKSPITLRSLPASDSWDRWNEARDRQLAGNTPVYQVPTQVIYSRPSVWFSLDIPFGYGHPYYPYYPYYHSRDTHWYRR